MVATKQISTPVLAPYMSPSSFLSKLPHVAKKFYNGASLAGPDLNLPNNNLRIGVFGDSVGNQKPQHISRHLKAGMGDGGGFYNYPIDSAGATYHQDVSDTTYWWNGYWHTVPAGGTVEFLENGGRANATTLKVYYVQESGGGTFKVQTNSGSGYADESGFTAVSAANGTTQAGIITLTKAAGSTWSMKIVGVSGTVRIIGCAHIYETGTNVSVFNFDQGGLELYKSILCPSAILTPIFTDLALDLAFMELKDNAEFATAFPSFMSYWTGSVNAAMDWVFIGTTPEQIETTTGSYNVTNNGIQRDYADAHGVGFAYFDGYGPIGSWATLNALGWGNDGTHPAPACQLFLASLLWNFLGLDMLLETVSGRIWRYANGNFTIQPTGQGVMRWNVTDSPVNGLIDLYSDGQEFTFKGARNYNFRSSDGTYLVTIDSNQNTGATGIQTRTLGLVTPSNTPVGAGPCLRPGGSSNGDAVVISSIAPGDGSGVAPIQTSQVQINVQYGTPVTINRGGGAPSISAPVGSIYLRTDGGANTTLYVKESGTGNTGWIAK